MDSALPRPETIIDWPFFRDGWAGRTYLQSISISDGVAAIDWSEEFAAWGGGSARMHMIGEQIRATLGQFPTVSDFAMTVNGSDQALQP